MEKLIINNNKFLRSSWKVFSKLKGFFLTIIFIIFYFNKVYKPEEKSNFALDISFYIFILAIW